jgi:hypothetical protein
MCTSTPITIIQIASSNVGGDRRADTPQSRQLPSSYQVTLGGLGKAAATQHWQVSPRATFRNRVSRRRPESASLTGRHHHPSLTLSSGMVPHERSTILVAIYAPSVDVLLAWLVERLGPKAVNRTAKVMLLVCALATVAFVVVLLVLLAR